MKKEKIGWVLIAIAILLLLAIPGGEEHTPWRIAIFLASIVSFLALLGYDVGDFDFFGRNKKVVDRLTIANYFLVMLLAPCPLSGLIQALNTVIAMIAFIYWTWPYLARKFT